MSFRVEALQWPDSEAADRRVSVLSYNVLAHARAEADAGRHGGEFGNARWDVRRGRLLREVVRRKPDVAVLLDLGTAAG